MSHVGSIGQKISIDVILVGIYEWMNYSFSYYGKTNYIYTMKDETGNVFVWKTSSFMSVQLEGKDSTGNDQWYGIQKNDLISITGVIKEHSNYKGEDQTVLQRVKVNKLIKHDPTWEEKKAAKQQEQLDSLKDGDFVWVMPYKQYKEHYSDCETIYHSYNEHSEEEFKKSKRVVSTIAVIIRKGRLKNSGVRGEHYSGYEMQNEIGQKCTYRAVSEENAMKRVKKDFPDHTWECVKIYQYQY